MNNSNLKDTLTTIFGILGAISGSILAAASGGLEIPPAVKAICGGVAAISVGVIGWLTGKAPNATTKTDSQVVAGNVPNPSPDTTIKP